MNNQQSFDVFLCHNSNDKFAVEDIGKQLERRGVRPWIDSWHLPALHRYRLELERIISHIDAAAIFIGPSGQGPWQSLEIDVLLNQHTQRGMKLGFVLLPGCPDDGLAPSLFMKAFNWVDLRKSDLDPIGRIIDTIMMKQHHHPDQRIDYTQLKDLLVVQLWEEADRKTLDIMRNIFHRPFPQALSRQEIDNFPCQELQIINQLWVEYSIRKFGFSVQKTLADSFLKYRKGNFDDFLVQIGRGYGGFTKEAEQLISFIAFKRVPQGYYPGKWLNAYSHSVNRSTAHPLGLLFERLETCKINS